MNSVGWDILLVLAFVLVGGFFAAAEMALVSLREGQVRSLSRRGRRGQRVARLAHDPNRFLSAVQIGVTTATLLSGAFGAETLANDLKGPLAQHMPSGVASALAVVIVTLVISFASLILGELAPKRLALQRPERVALTAAPTLDRLALLARPLVWLLSVSTNVVVRLLGGDPKAGRKVMTSEELRDLIVGHQTLTVEERHIMSEVFDAGTRQIREVLVPRTEVEFLPAVMPLSEAIDVAADAPYSRFPVFRESHDDVIGFVHARDLLRPVRTRQAHATPVAVGDVCRSVKMLPISKTVMAALTEMRRDKAHLAIVVDEYGGTAGIVTLEDLVEELIGDIQDEYDREAESSRKLLGGAIDVDGLLNLDDFAEQTAIELPDGPYETVAGFLLAALGHLPVAGESAEVAGHRLTVTELDGRRISRVRVSPAGAVPGALPGQRPGGGRQDGGAAPGSVAAAAGDGTAGRLTR